CQQVDNSPYSF
nr:immunoglobulin light chain junction region [Macaca mulatta]